MKSIYLRGNSWFAIKKVVGLILIIILFVTLWSIVEYRQFLGKVIWKYTKNEHVASFFNPNDEEFSWQIADYYFNGGAYDLERALRYYEKILARDPLNEHALYQKARIYFINGDLEDALEQFNYLVELSPQNNRGYYMRGLTYSFLNEFDKAIEDFKRVLEAAPEEWAGYNDLAWVYFRKGDFEKASDVARIGVERFHDNAWLVNLYGISLMNLGRYDEAEKYLSRGRELVYALTADDWTAAYPGNNPAGAEADLAQMKQAADTNVQLVQEKMKNEL